MAAARPQPQGAIGRSRSSDLDRGSSSSSSSRTASRSSSSNVTSVSAIIIPPRVKIDEDNHMPLIGLATWKAGPNQVHDAVKYAISIGYRYIDCAFAYQNEAEVGSAILEKLTDNTVKREDLFIASKLWNTFHKREQVQICFNKSLTDLGLNYLDLYVIHWPIAFVSEGEEYFPRNENGDMITEDVDFIETWRGMEELCEQKLVKSIGLSNFNLKQLERILSICKIRPSVLQIECHPYLNQIELIEFCKKQNITVAAITPLGAPDRPWNRPTEPNLLSDFRIQELLDRYNKTAAQIALKFNVQRGVAVLPASVNHAEINEYLQIFDFEISGDDMNSLSTCRQHRFNTYERSKHDSNYPFHTE